MEPNSKQQEKIDLPTASNSEETKNSSWCKAFAAPGWGILLLFLAFKMAQPWIGDNNTRTYSPTRPSPSNSRTYNQSNPLLRSDHNQSDLLFSIRAKNTTNYWRVTVANLHSLRFADPPADSEEPAADYYQRFLTDFERTLQSAQSASSANVDSDLVKMSQAHLQMDAQMVMLARQVQQLNEERKDLPSNETLRQQHAQEGPWLEKLMNLEDEEIAALPEQVQQLIFGLRQLPETREQQYREIEIMQARLTERYPGQSFTLPELVLDPE